MKRRFWKFALVLLVPLALYAYISERNSWRPKTLSADSHYQILQVKFAPDGQRLAVAFDDKSGGKDKIALWDTRRLLLLNDIPSPDSFDLLHSISFEPHGKFLAAIFHNDPNTFAAESSFGYIGNKVRFFDMASSKWYRSMLLPNSRTDHDPIYNATNSVSCFWPDKENITYYPYQENSFRLFRLNLSTVKCDERDIRPQELERGRIVDVAFSPNNVTIAYTSIVSSYGILNLKLYDFGSRKITHQLAQDDPVKKYGEIAIDADGSIHRGEEFGNLVFSPNGASLACPTTINNFKNRSSTQHIKIWNVRNGKLVRVLNPAVALPESIAFSPDGNLIACDDGKTIKLWNLTSGKIQRILQGHKNKITSVVFSPDGRTLASGGNDGTVKLWRIK